MQEKLHSEQVKIIAEFVKKNSKKKITRNELKSAINLEHKMLLNIKSDFAPFSLSDIILIMNIFIHDEDNFF